MSGFVCPHCHKEIDLFKRGGGETASHELYVPFLGSIPFVPDLVEMADNGTPFVHSRKDSKSAMAFAQIVQNIGDFLGGKGSAA